MAEDRQTISSEIITDLPDLVHEVYERIGNPVNVWAVAAMLESIGIRDVDAREDFGFDSVFKLAEIVYDKLKEHERKTRQGVEKNLEKPKPLPLVQSVRMFIKYYSRGLLFSMPVVSQVVAVLLFRYSLWAWLEFNEAQATVVAFGTITAFIVTGGFIQTLGRALTRYISESNYLLAFKATQRIMNAGILTTILVAIGFVLLNIIIPFYPPAMLIMGLVYYVLISLLLLSSGVLYALEQRLAIVSIIILGTVAVIIGMDLLHIGIYFSQWFGIGITIMILVAYGYLYFRIKINTLRQELKNQVLPAPEVRYYINYRYFVYGLAYFLFLFMDRILAWSAGPPPPPYIMWFNTPYELGMDWALISMILMIAVLEYSINAFSRQLLPLQEKTFFPQINTFSAYFRQFYYRQLVLLTVVGLLSIGITYFGINSLQPLQDRIPELKDFFANPLTFRVFWIASISYLFMVVGLLHTLFFFTLNKPSFAMYAIGAAVIVNFFVGYICSRMIALEYATIGLAAGSIAFAVFSGIIAKRFFKRLDYYYYSAF